MCSVLKLFSLEVDPTFLAFRTELHATTHTAVELEAALVPCYAAAVAREVVIVQSCDTDGVSVKLEAVYNIVARVGSLADIVRHVEDGRTNSRPVDSRETGKNGACPAHALRPADPVASPRRPRVVERGALGL